MDGGSSGGKEQGDEWNIRLPDSPPTESFQIWEQGSVDGAKLHGRENFRGWGVLGGELYELSHPSGVLPETSPFYRRRESFKGLSSRIFKQRGNRILLVHSQYMRCRSRHLPEET